MRPQLLSVYVLNFIQVYTHVYVFVFILRKKYRMTIKLTSLRNVAAFVFLSNSNPISMWKYTPTLYIICTQNTLSCIYHPSPLIEITLNVLSVTMPDLVLIKKILSQWYPHSPLINACCIISNSSLPSGPSSCPELNMDGNLKQATVRRKSNHPEIIRPVYMIPAYNTTVKLISIAWFFIIMY